MFFNITMAGTVQQSLSIYLPHSTYGNKNCTYFISNLISRFGTPFMWQIPPKIYNLKDLLDLLLANIFPKIIFVLLHSLFVLMQIHLTLNHLDSITKNLIRVSKFALKIIMFTLNFFLTIVLSNYMNPKKFFFIEVLDLTTGISFKVFILCLNIFLLVIVIPVLILHFPIILLLTVPILGILYSDILISMF